MKALIYTQPDCPYCVKAKDLLAANKIEIMQEIDISKLPDVARQRFKETYRTVPQVFIDQRHIGGFEALEVYLD